MFRRFLFQTFLVEPVFSTVQRFDSFDPDSVKLNVVELVTCSVLLLGWEFPVFLLSR